MCLRAPVHVFLLVTGFMYDNYERARYTFRAAARCLSSITVTTVTDERVTPLKIALRNDGYAVQLEFKVEDCHMWMT